jgi:sugar lactone lactonase YvrE
MGLGQDGQGNLYVADRGRSYGGYLVKGSVLWRVDASGCARIIAGTGYRGSSPPGPALEADLGSMEGMDVDEEGRITIADSSNHLVLRIDAGRLTHLAGTGREEHGPDGGPASATPLARPYDVRIAPDGSVVIAEHGANAVRRIGPDGVMGTIAGTGEAGYGGDGGPAAQASLNGPYGVEFDHQGRLLIADSGNHVVRRVDTNGIISTIAGDGREGLSGDGGPALAARFSSPQSLAVDAEGRIYVGDEHNHRVRMIGLDGTVTTIAGGGAEAAGAPGALATDLALEDPEFELARSDGTVLIADADHRRLVERGPAGHARILAGAGAAPGGDACEAGPGA